VIDWLTVIAQVINFLILVVLLRYFLYGRIMAAMDARQREIAARWDEAQQQREEAKKELQAAQEKNYQLEDQREQLLAKVQDEVELHRQQLTTKVRSEVDELRSRWSVAVEEEIESFLRDLRRRASEEVFAIARRVLTDLANANLEQQIVEKFLHKIEHLGDDERQTVITSLSESNRVVVQSTFDISDDLQQVITNTLHERFPIDIDIQFELSADLLCGIALQTDAHNLAWNLRNYFISLEQELQQTLEEEAVNSKLTRKQTVEVNNKP